MERAIPEKCRLQEDMPLILLALPAQSWTPTIAFYTRRTYQSERPSRANASAARPSVHAETIAKAVVWAIGSFRCSRAPINAIPNAKPICRIVTQIADAVAARSDGTAETAVAVICALNTAQPAPPTSSAPTTAQMASGALRSRAANASKRSAPPTIPSPPAKYQRAGSFALRRPTAAGTWEPSRRLAASLWRLD